MLPQAMASNICRNCGNPDVITDPDRGNRVCQSCGLVHDSAVYHEEAFASDGTPLGSIIHSAGEYGYRERKLNLARQSIKTVTDLLNLSASHAYKVSFLVSRATGAEFGSGTWFTALVAACAVIVMRRDNRPLSISEAAAIIGRHPQDLGRMVTRVLQHLDDEEEEKQLPGFESGLLLERLVTNFRPFNSLDKKKSEEIIGQGRFILHCAMRWFLMTGRNPLPIVAAVLAFVSDVNGLVVSVEEIAREIHAGVSTSRIRLKELREVLVKASKVLLPWGKDVTVKNVVQHAPILIRFMELKSKAKSNAIGEDVNACLLNLDDILNAYSDYSNVIQEESKYFSLGERDQRLGSDDELQRLKISGEQISISHAYRRILDMLPGICNEGNSKNVYGSKRRRRAGLDRQDWIESWEGRWKSEKGLKFEQVLQRSEGYDTLPPSFINGIDLQRKRKMKMEAAKHRINKIRKRTSDNVEVEPSREEGTRPINLPLSRKRKKDGVTDELDWEDSIIELLLLHQVDEEEILQGHYNRLMDVYVFSYPES